jgi:hypothetical protein
MEGRDFTPWVLASLQTQVDGIFASAPKIAHCLLGLFGHPDALEFASP